MNAAGRMSDAKRNEGQLLCDILGLESLVDEITYKLASTAADEGAGGCAPNSDPSSEPVR